jgi:hypothetical protein
MHLALSVQPATLSSILYINNHQSALTIIGSMEAMADVAGSVQTDFYRIVDN